MFGDHLVARERDGAVAVSFRKWNNDLETAVLGDIDRLAWRGKGRKGRGVRCNHHVWNIERVSASVSSDISSVESSPIAIVDLYALGNGPRRRRLIGVRNVSVSIGSTKTLGVRLTFLILVGICLRILPRDTPRICRDFLRDNLRELQQHASGIVFHVFVFVLHTLSLSVIFFGIFRQEIRSGRTGFEESHGRQMFTVAEERRSGKQSRLLLLMAKRVDILHVSIVSVTTDIWSWGEGIGETGRERHGKSLCTFSFRNND